MATQRRGQKFAQDSSAIPLSSSDSCRELVSKARRSVRRDCLFIELQQRSGGEKSPIGLNFTKALEAFPSPVLSSFGLVLSIKL